MAWRRNTMKNYKIAVEQVVTKQFLVKDLDSNAWILSDDQ